MGGHDERNRRRAVTEMLASWRIEGFEPDPEYLAMLERYIAGDVTLDELGQYSLKACNLPVRTAA